jgi:hypothetical protein
VHRASDLPPDPMLMDAQSLCDSGAFGKARLQLDLMSERN